VDPRRSGARRPRPARFDRGARYLTLALALALAAPIIDDLLRVEQLGRAVNYGLGRVRFPAPVPAGARVRGEVTVTSAQPVPGGLHLELSLVVEVEGGSRPACVADLLIRLYEPDKV
jgi:acyl dehydratase